MMRTRYFILTAVILTITSLTGTQALAKTDKKDDDNLYKFSTIKENPITSIKNQNVSGTCWCFSTLSFLESELLRTKGKTYDLSEMWVVGHAYSDRALKYLRLDGMMGFRSGSTFADVMAVIRKYGIVPQGVYSGMQYGSDLPDQKELDAVLKGYMDGVISKPNKSSTRPWKVSTAWRKGLEAVIQAYMGEWPSKFDYEGKEYTPESFRDEELNFNADDYVNICSFIAEPLYSFVPIEVCDNWRNATGFNVTLKDMLEIMYNALDNGYTVLWAGDVSEKGFDRNGLGVLPVEKSDKPAAGSDQEHWTGKAKEEKVKQDRIPPEVQVSDSLRQSAYDRKLTTDDHGMHIFGYAQDQNGTKYFLTKNSWGETGKYKGIWYLSETFVAYKTLNFIIHKDALPEALREKLKNAGNSF